MEFKQLQSYVAVVKYGSFTKAAEKLFVSQPTISAHVSSLEEELKKTLIIRSTKNVEVTEKGKEIYEYALRILELRGRMIRECQEDDSPVISLGSSTIPSTYILPEILPRFRKQYPETCFEIHQSDSQGVVDGLHDGIFDVGLIGMKDETGLVCEPFCQDRVVLITPVTDRFLEMKNRAETPLEELLAEPIILREKGSGTGKSAAKFLESIGVKEEQLHITARINDQETIKNLVAGGLGVSIISEMAVRNFVKEKRILQFELPEKNCRSLYIVYRPEEKQKSYITDFIKFVRTTYRYGSHGI